MPEPRITKIEFLTFNITLPNVGSNAAGSAVRFEPGPGSEQLRFAIRLHSDAGVIGEYVPPRARAKVVMSAAMFLAPRLIASPCWSAKTLQGNAPRDQTRGGGGHWRPDIALWDAAGKLVDQPITR